MNEQKLQYIIEILKRGEGGAAAAADLQKFVDASKKADQSSEQLKRAVGAVTAAFGGFLLVRSWVKEVDEADRVSARLTGTLRANGQSSKEYREELDLMAKRLQAVTTATDETVTAIQAQLIAFGATRDQLPELTEMVLDLVAAGHDLGSVTGAIGGGLNGQFGGFSRLLKVGFDEAKSDAENFAIAIDIVRERYGGLARELANTPTGQLKQLQNQASDLKEELGRAWLQGMQPWMGALATIFGSLNNVSQETSALRTVGASAFSALTAGAVTFNFALLAIKANNEFIKAGMTPIISGKTLGASIAGVAGAISIVGAIWEANKMIRAASEASASEAGDATMLQRQRSAVESYMRDLEAAAQLTKEKADEIRADLDHAFGTGDVEAQRTALKSATGVLLPAGESPEPSARLSQEQIEARRQLLAIERELQVEQLQGIEREALQAQFAAEARREEIEQLRKKGDITEEQYNRIIELDEAAYAVRLRQITLPKLQEHAEEELTIKTLASSRSRTEQIDEEFAQRIANYNSWFEKGVLTEAQLTELTERASRKRIMDLAQEEAQRRQMYEQTARSAANAFASGFSDAVIKSAQNIKEADKAWQEFAANFLRSLADMIIQMTVLIALKAAAKALGYGSYLAEGGMVAAGAGIVQPRMAANGLEGVNDVATPTYFPKFNVLAGEAGREIMTVLARPSFFERDGMRGMTGMAQGKRLMILPADQAESRLMRAAGAHAGSGPASGGNSGGVADGNVHIAIELSPELEARIVEKSVNKADVQILKNLGSDTQHAQAVRRLVS